VEQFVVGQQPLATALSLIVEAAGRLANNQRPTTASHTQTPAR
jgi:hypothetical protein